ncbi:MAG: hypothetical protein PHW77_01235 [Eubacteriales bacterium]|nr:hypothetical protein [Eubacteriales bacterium]
MSGLKIEDYINDELPFNDQQNAMEFVEYLKNYKMEFIKDNDYWKNKIYYIIKYNNKCVCFIAIKDPDEKDNRWTVWSDDMGSKCFEEFQTQKGLKVTAWKHIDFCGNCGSCGDGRRKIIFGKEFNNVCVCTFRIDNPDKEDLLFMKTMVEIRIKEILNSAL